MAFAGLHPDEELLVEFCMLLHVFCVFHAVSLRSGLVKLLALSNFPALYIMNRVSQNFTARIVAML